MTDLKRAVSELRKGGSFTLSSVPEGFDAFCVADLAHSLARDAEKRAVVFVHVARDETRARAFNEALAFAAPGAAEGAASRESGAGHVFGGAGQCHRHG